MSLKIKFPKIENLPPYPLGDIAKRIHEIRISGEQVIDLSQLNPTIPPPQLAIDALVQASLVPHNHRYSASSGISSLRETFAKYYLSKFNSNLDHNSEVVVTSGTKEAVIHLMMCMLSPGDSILVPVPAYPVHTAAAALLGVSFVGVPLWSNYQSFYEQNGVLSADSEYFFSRLKNRFLQTWPRPKVILTSFPHNPTTTIVTKSFYERLIEFSNQYNCFIINDFAHGDLFFEKNKSISFLSLENAKNYGAEIYSLSKGFCLPGWRVGAALGHAEVLNALKSLKSYSDFGIFQPLQIAATKVLTEEISNKVGYLNEIVETYSNRRKLICAGLRDLGWKINDSKATPFVWAQIPEQFENIDSSNFCKNLLEEYQVALFPGTAFDSEQVGCVRISLIENESKLREAVKRISIFQSSLKG
jgi:alanine-synthesizing transaminase